MKRQFRISLNGKTFEVEAEMIGEELPPPPAPSQGGGRRGARSGGASVPAPQPSAPQAAPVSADGALPSPLAGKVVSIDAPAGTQVEAGQTVITLEAMKMNTVVAAPQAGTVEKVHVNPGDAVEEGQPLLTIA